jgi:4'-phosphopantetheinyl transferase
MIPRNEVQVWFASAKESRIEAETCLSSLSGAEQQRARHFRFDRDRMRYVLGKYMVRDLLARTLHLRPQQIEFAFNKYGKPTLGRDCRVSFNLAHAGEYVVCALAVDRDIGVDIEAERTGVDFMDLASPNFCPSEIRNLEASSGTRRLHLFYKYWTLKEAYLKAEGSGLNTSLTEVDSSGVPDDCPGIPCPPVESVPRGILVQRIEAPLGYAAAVAATGGIWTTKVRQWRREEFSVERSFT